MDGEQTLGEIFDELSDQLATVRTRALMGEQALALELMLTAHRRFQEFREIFAGQPRFHALEYNYNATLTALCADESLSDRDPLRLDAITEAPTQRESPLQTLKSRKRGRVEKRAA